MEYNRNKSNNLNSYINKYGEERGLKKYNKFLKNCCCYSKVSQELFWNIYSRLDEESKNNTYFATLNREFHKRINNRSYLYDFVITSKNICIEFNGDDWHANPKKYFASEIPGVYKNIDGTLTAKKIWERDKQKNGLLISMGYDIITVWESDFKKNPNHIIEKCMGEIKNANNKN